MLRAVGRLSAGAENIDARGLCARGCRGRAPGHGQCRRRGRICDRCAAADAAPRAGAQLRGHAGRARTRRLHRRPRRHDAGGPAAGGTAARFRRAGHRLRPGGACQSDGLWARWKIAPMGLRELVEQSDAVCVLLNYFTRYKGLIGERFLPTASPTRCWSAWAFEPVRRGGAGRGAGIGRMAAAWFDSLEPGMLDPGRPLHGGAHAAGHAARGQHDARVAHPQRLGGRAAHRREC